MVPHIPAHPQGRGSRVFDIPFDRDSILLLSPDKPSAKSSEERGQDARDHIRSVVPRRHCTPPSQFRLFHPTGESIMNRRSFLRSSAVAVAGVPAVAMPVAAVVL